MAESTEAEVRREPPTAEYPEVRDYPEVSERDTERIPDKAEPAAAPATSVSSNRFLRGLFWVIASIGLVMAMIVGAQSVGWLPEFKNPFASEKQDRSQPPLLNSIQDLSRYVAAEGNFQVIIDVQENRKYIPDFLVNDRVLFVAAGTVEAYVDFSNIGEGAIKASDDRRTVEVTLPEPQLGKPNLDPDNSRVFSQQRGLLNRIQDAFSNDPNKMADVYKLAEERISEAANASTMGERAKENTKKMLEGLLRSLGYQVITITYKAP
jgi:hypothetical protein